MRVDPLVVQVEEELVVEALNVFDRVDDALEVLILLVSRHQGWDCHQRTWRSP